MEIWSGVTIGFDLVLLHLLLFSEVAVCQTVSSHRKWERKTKRQMLFLIKCVDKAYHRFLFVYIKVNAWILKLLQRLLYNINLVSFPLSLPDRSGQQPIRSVLPWPSLTPVNHSPLSCTATHLFHICSDHTMSNLQRLSHPPFSSLVFQ